MASSELIHSDTNTKCPLKFSPTLLKPRDVSLIFIRTMDLLFKEKFIRIFRFLWLLFCNGSSCCYSNLRTRLIFDSKKVGIRAKPPLSSSRTGKIGPNKPWVQSILGSYNITVENSTLIGKLRPSGAKSSVSRASLHRRSQERHNRLTLQNLLLSKIISLCLSVQI